MYEDSVRAVHSNPVANEIIKDLLEERRTRDYKNWIENKVSKFTASSSVLAKEISKLYKRDDITFEDWQYTLLFKKFKRILLQRANYPPENISNLIYSLIKLLRNDTALRYLLIVSSDEYVELILTKLVQILLNEKVYELEFRNPSEDPEKMKDIRKHLQRATKAAAIANTVSKHWGWNGGQGDSELPMPIKAPSKLNPGTCKNCNFEPEFPGGATSEKDVGLSDSCVPLPRTLYPQTNPDCSLSLETDCPYDSSSQETKNLRRRSRPRGPYRRTLIRMRMKEISRRRSMFKKYEKLLASRARKYSKILGSMARDYSTSDSDRPKSTLTPTAYQRSEVTRELNDYLGLLKKDSSYSYESNDEVARPTHDLADTSPATTLANSSEGHLSGSKDSMAYTDEEGTSFDRWSEDRLLDLLGKNSPCHLAFGDSEARLGWLETEASPLKKVAVPSSIHGKPLPEKSTVRRRSTRLKNAQKSRVAENLSDDEDSTADELVKSKGSEKGKTYGKSFKERKDASATGGKRKSDETVWDMVQKHHKYNSGSGFSASKSVSAGSKESKEEDEMSMLIREHYHISENVPSTQTQPFLNAYKNPKSVKWSQTDTKRFYRAIETFGTDLMMVRAYLPEYTDRQVYDKFKLEERKNPQMMQNALQTQKSISLKQFEQKHGKIDTKTHYNPLSDPFLQEQASTKKASLQLNLNHSEQVAKESEQKVDDKIINLFM